MTSVIGIAKRPRPGRVKTRLVPPLTHTQAAAVAAAALRDTLRAVDATGADDRVLAFDGRMTGWLAPGWRAVRQPVGGLDERLAAAFGAAAGPVVLVGMDTPQLRPEHLAAFDPQHFDACVGLSTDGGYWAIGFADPSHAPAAIRGVPMSTPHTGAVQLNRLACLGLRVQQLDALTDVDTIDAAHHVAAEAPDTEFAAVLRHSKRRAS
jgi:glycosyltransferase A (GT-A) superfamily protein (DUF2064 family)